MKKVIIIGAGPAGITAALELLRRGKNEYDVTVLEESDSIGGISRTVNLDGNRMDIGGHRFFSKEQRVNEWWQSILPLQGAPSKDDKLLKREAHLVKGGADPEKTARDSGIMLTVAIDEINERLFDTFSDTVIIFDGDTPEIIEDYKEELKGMFNI